MKRPFISLGDALRAAHALEPRDTEARAAIRQLLGLEDDEATTPATPSAGAALPSSSEQVAPAPSEPADPLRWRRTPESAEPPAAQAPVTPVSFTIERTMVGSGPPVAPAWVTVGESLAPDVTAEPALPEPLFSRVQRRGILSAALATYVAEGDLDVDAAIETIAAHQPLTSVPRLPTPTLRRGAQMLLDGSAGMDPYLADRDALVQHLDDILSDDRLEVLHFVGCPTRGVSERAGGRKRPWQAPPSHTPVVVVTDLGIGGPLLDEDRAGVREWLRFAHRARGDGHTPITLVPYEARRWPPLLARAMVVLHWSERTTAGEVRRVMDDAIGYRR